MSNQVHTVVTTVLGTRYAIFGVDGSKAPAFAQNFNEADAPEKLTNVVNESINYDVALYAAQVLSGRTQTPLWITFRPHGIVAVETEEF